MTDFDVQRRNMVDSQVRPSDVTDRRIVRAMLDTPRERFAPAAVQAICYMDRELPVIGAEGSEPARYLLAPAVLARMLQALNLSEQDTVLDVGCATGYAAALLAKIVKSVVALDADPRLITLANDALHGSGVANVTVVNGPHAGGAADSGPFDAMLLEGRVDEVPPGLLDQLKDGGRLVALLMDAGVSRVALWRRLGGMFDTTVLFDAPGPTLPGFERAAAFVF